MSYDPKDNPLKDVKVHLPTDFDAQRVVYRMIHGTDLGYIPARGLESIKERQKREGQQNF